MGRGTREREGTYSASLGTIDPARRKAAVSLWWPTPRTLRTSRSHARSARRLGSCGGIFLPISAGMMAREPKLVGYER